MPAKYLKSLISFTALALVAAGCATTTEAPAPAVETAPVQKENPWDPKFYTPVPMPSAALNTGMTLNRITFGSCFDPSEDGHEIWQTVAAARGDAFLFIGDNVYGDVHGNDPGLPELRDAYGQLAASQSFADFRKTTPVLATWDDHDFGLNDAGASFSGREQAEKLFNYVWATPENDPQLKYPGIYNSTIIGNEEGKRVQIILLDTRYFRSDLQQTDERNAPGKERYIPDPDPAKTQLGETQWQWLRTELDKPADVRLIASSIQVIADGHGWEAWRQLPAERQKLYDTINASGASGVIVLSGDRHAAGLYTRKGVLTYPLHEITSSSLNLPLSGWLKPEDLKQEAGPYRIGDNFFDVNFGAIDFNWDDRLVTLNVMNEEGVPVMSNTIAIDDLTVGN